MASRALTGRLRRMADENGFTLIEMLTAAALVAVMATLGATVFRSYWLTNSLYGGRDELVSELRRAQEQAVSESHPKVFGARFLAGSSTWGVVEYDPTVPSCVEVRSEQLPSGTRVIPSPAPAFTSTAETTYCAANLRYTTGTVVPNRSTSAYVFFYARGTATPGTLTLDNPSISGKTVGLTVTPITGRVTKT